LRVPAEKEFTLEIGQSPGPGSQAGAATGRAM
jgi:hypothetical protein